MTFSSNPTRKIEIKQRADTLFIDVTSYVIKDSTLNLGSGSRISGGRFTFDRDVLNVVPDLTSLDEIKVTLGDDTPDTLVFTGLLRDGGDDDIDETIKYDVKSFAILASDRRATEVYRSDAGTGEPVAVFKDLINKKLPELSYDDTSIPPNDGSFEDYKDLRIQNKVIKTQFDEIANYMKRTWYVDENKKIWLVERVFTDTGYKLETGNSSSAENNIIGNLTIATDLKRWANYVSVDGLVFEIGNTEKFNGDTTTTKFILTTRPKEVKVTVDGDVKSGAIPGSDFADDADYLINKDEPSIEFQAGSIPGKGTENVVIDLISHSKIHDEYPDTGSITKHGEREKTIKDDTIDTLAKAKEIALNALTIYSVPLKIYSGKTFWNKNVRPLKRVTLRDSSRSVNLSVNVIETNIVFGEKSFEIRFKLNDFDFTTVDLYADLVSRVNRIEFNERSSGDQIAKYLFFGADFAVSVNNLHISSEGICNAFTLDHADTGLDDATVYLDGCDGTAGLLDQGNVRIVNLDNAFIEDFFGTFYKGSGNGGPGGGPDWNTTDKRLYMTSQTSKKVSYTTVQDIDTFHLTGNTAIAIRPNCNETKWEKDVIKYSFRVDSGTWTEPVLNSERVDLSALGETGTIIEGRVIFEGNGARDTYINQLKFTVEEST